MGVGAPPSLFPTTPAGTVTAYLIFHLLFVCGVTGDMYFNPIWDEVTWYKNHMEGMATINQVLLWGILS